MVEEREEFGRGYGEPTDAFGNKTEDYEIFRKGKNPEILGNSGQKSLGVFINDRYYPFEISDEEGREIEDVRKEGGLVRFAVEIDTKELK